MAFWRYDCNNNVSATASDGSSIFGRDSDLQVDDSDFETDLDTYEILIGSKNLLKICKV